MDIVAMTVCCVDFYPKIGKSYLGGNSLNFAAQGMAPRYKALSGKTGVLLVQAMGAAGSLAFHEGKTWRQAAIPVPEVVDTTGCGDSYFAAFTVNYATTHDIAASMRAGALAAAVTLSRFGGVGE